MRARATPHVFSLKLLSAKPRVLRKLEMGVVRVRSSTGSGHSPSSAGARGAASWLALRGLDASMLKRWHVEVSLGTTDEIPTVNYDDRVDTRFHIDVYSEEWGYFFCHAGKASWIRVTDIPFVHGRDDFGLLAQTPALTDVGALMRALESRHQIELRRKHALVRTNLAGSEPAIRRWVESL